MRHTTVYFISRTNPRNTEQPCVSIDMQGAVSEDAFLASMVQNARLDDIQTSLEWRFEAHVYLGTKSTTSSRYRHIISRLRASDLL